MRRTPSIVICGFQVGAFVQKKGDAFHVPTIRSGGKGGGALATRCINARASLQ